MNDLLDSSNSYKTLKTDYCCPTLLEVFNVASSSAPFSESFQRSLNRQDKCFVQVSTWD